MAIRRLSNCDGSSSAQCLTLLPLCHCIKIFTKIDLKRNLDKLAEPFLHPIFVSSGVIAQDQVETSLEVALVIMIILVIEGEELRMGW